MAALALYLLPAAAQDNTTLRVLFEEQPAAFPLVGKGAAVALYVEPGTAKVVSIAAAAFRDDVKEITGIAPALKSELPAGKGFAVIIGTLGNGGWVDELTKKGKISTGSVSGKWESFSISIVGQPFDNIPQALVIAGSDARGTAFGVFELCRMMGVSPWTWWADVHPAPHKDIYISRGSLLQGPPSVKYRGIFLNDEDWGLQPWAAHKMDPDIKDIGPNTYTRIFELLLRLKANYIWPAMHPCTRAFYYYPDNPRLANDYGIVVGSSHCEPMLRNNIFEWAENYSHEYGIAPGEWRYDHNRTQIYNYWKDRVTQSNHYESVYTVGMRGIHDGSMPGPAPIPEKVKLLQQVISDQRELLGNGTGKPLQAIPQIFCPYKEVLTVYRSGLQLPDDVTIVWADDNHGYIRQLSDEQEQQRSGRSGVYYHLSYWGAPQDYLWLSSVSPALVSYEMSKAYQYGADRLWVFNVGDIKPAEMEIEFSMDLAWNVKQRQPAQVTSYIHQWAARTFGEMYADEITEIKKTYYMMAQAGKPEHLNSVRYTDLMADARLDNYKRIAAQANALYAKMPARLKDAFYELILYPVEGARRMNEKILYARKSIQLAARGKQEALLYAQKAQAAFDTIGQLTNKYNDSTAGGKWSGIMSWHPRNQAVFNMPPVASQWMIDSARAAQAGQPPVPAEKVRMGLVEGAPGAYPAFIPAILYTQKHEPAGYTFQAIEGLGVGRRSITIFPFVNNTGDPVDKAPWLEYTFNSSPGTHTLLLQCLPTQSTGSKGLLRYAVSVNGGAPQVVNIHTESESRTWKENVLRGYAVGKCSIDIPSTGQGAVVARLRLYFLDPGLVVNSLEID